MTGRQCHYCGTPLINSVVDLGRSPLANSFLSAEQLSSVEPTYPLQVFICHQCYLVQLEEFQSPEQIFSEYLYFSSYSKSWLDHCRTYAQRMILEQGLGSSSLVVEVGSNDGSLLQYFKREGVAVLGIDPAANVAEVARVRGVPTEVAFFGVETAQRLRKQGRCPDLIVANNVLAHVPDLKDFVGGLASLLKPGGLITIEFPHLLNLIAQGQFDTIYHEHFSYLSLLTAERMLADQDLTVVDVEAVNSHGGSLRLLVRPAPSVPAVSERVVAMRAVEQAAGLHEPASYRQFAAQVVETRTRTLAFLAAASREGKRIAAYGAPAKGNTLLNYCGIRKDRIAFTVDRSPHKQGRYLPGSHLPILAPEALYQARPDYLIILPWNLKEEIMDQMAGIREWGGKFVVLIPDVQVL